MSHGQHGNHRLIAVRTTECVHHTARAAEGTQTPTLPRTPSRFRRAPDFLPIGTREHAHSSLDCRLPYAFQAEGSKEQTRKNDAPVLAVSNSAWRITAPMIRPPISVPYATKHHTWLVSNKTIPPQVREVLARLRARTGRGSKIAAVKASFRPWDCHSSHFGRRQMGERDI